MAGLVGVQSVGQKKVGPDLPITLQKRTVQVDAGDLAFRCVADQFFNQRFQFFCKPPISTLGWRKVTGLCSGDVDRQGQSNNRGDSVVPGLDNHGEEIGERRIDFTPPTTDRSSRP